MKTHLFKIECLTDMHVGNGEANYSIIDNEAQKDTVLSDVPIIRASGVKGALKERFERAWGKDSENILSVFGGTKVEKDKDGKIKLIAAEGEYKFLSALCVARPLRVSDGDMPYILCSGEDVLDSFSKLLCGLGCGCYKHEEFAYGNGFFSNVKGIEIEGEKSEYRDSEKLKKLIGPSFAVAKSLRDYPLPVRARNKLDDNGLSENLWYEELVPHKSILYFAVIIPENHELYDKFKEVIEESWIQFGGNASVGNGYTKITEVFPNE